MSGSSDPKKLAVWRERFERFSSSGLAVARFCARERVSVASFYYWRQKLAVNGQPAPRPVLGHKGQRRRMTNGHPQHRTGSAEGHGVFQRVAVVAARVGAVRGAPAVVPPARGLVPVVSGSVPAGRAVCIQLPCGTRIEVGADDLDAIRTVLAEVVRADRGWEVARADGRGEGGVVSC